MWQRWNQTTHIFEKSTDDGANWTPLPLDGSIISEGLLSVSRIPDLDAAKITTGILDRSRIPSQLAYEDEANIFTKDQQVSKVRPDFQLKTTGANVKGHFLRSDGTKTELTQNLSYDGTNWNLDDTGDNGYLIRMGSPNAFEFYKATAGANPVIPAQFFRVSSTGQVLERGRSVAMGEWQDYTPVWASSGTQPSIGNGTLIGRYTLIGNTCLFRISLSIGSTTNLGSGTWLFGTPFAVNTVPNSVFTARLFRNGVSHFRAVGVMSNSTQMVLLMDSASGVQPTFPFTWVAGDGLNVSGVIELP